MVERIEVAPEEFAFGQPSFFTLSKRKGLDGSSSYRSFIRYPGSAISQSRKPGAAGDGNLARAFGPAGRVCRLRRPEQPVDRAGFPETHVAWHLVAPALAERFTVVVPDLPAMARSITRAWTKPHSSSAAPRCCR
jgi:hypothetical protein